MKFGVAALAGALALGAAACGDDEDDPPAATATEAPGVAGSPEGTNGTGATGATGGSNGATDEDETIEVTAIDYSFQGIPATIESGSELSLVNNSTIEAHEIVAIRLPDDETRSVEELLQLPEEELGEVAEIEPSLVIIARPDGGEGETVVGDGTLTESGRYLFACFIPIGADPDEYFEAAEGSTEAPDVEGGPPHFTMGMFAEATVE